VRRGVEVWISNHRSVAGIVDYVRRLGALVGVADKANAYADELQRGSSATSTRSAAPRGNCRPRLVEEWDDQRPAASEVAELVTSRGDDVFPELAAARLAKDRIVADPAEVVRRRLTRFASWCGKEVRPRPRRAPWLGRAPGGARRRARRPVAAHPAAGRPR
jgi:iron complex transport system substrate-binding protein